MTKNRVVDIDELEREYIYDQGTPPVSFTDLARRHGVARNTVSVPGTKRGWYEKRKAFRVALGMKVTEAMGDQWVALEAALTERLMSSGLAYLSKWEKALADDKITVSTRDALGVAAMLRTLAKDKGAEIGPDDMPRFVGPEDEEQKDPDEYRRALEAIRRIEAGETESDDASDPEEASPAGTRSN